MNAQQQWYANNLPLAGEVVADVGANVGRLSRFFWDGGPARLVSIEPEPSNVAALEELVRAAGSDRWTVEPCAVSCFEGTIEMRAMDTEHGRNSLVTDAGADLVEVPCRRLEDIVPDATVVKMDIEGHEYVVLPTALSMMPAVKAWALELHRMPGHPLEVSLAMLHDHGLRLTGAGRRRDDPSGEWVDVDVPPTLTWDSIPGVERPVDGVPGVFKMLHVLARR